MLLTKQAFEEIIDLILSAGLNLPRPRLFRISDLLFKIKIIIKKSEIKIEWINNNNEYRKKKYIMFFTQNQKL